MRRLIASVATLLVLASCEQASPEFATMSHPGSPPLRIETPDAAFRISEADRSTLRAGIDPNALQRFLAMVHPQYRQAILATFTLKPRGQGVTLFERVPDPVLQRALDEVWAPRSRTLTPEIVARAELNLRVRAEPVAFLLAADLPGTQAAAVVLHAGAGRDEIILRDAEADPALVANATERLIRSRMEHGIDPSTPVRLEVVSADQYRDLPPDLLPRQRDLLASLRAAPASHVPGIGPARRAVFQALESLE